MRIIKAGAVVASCLVLAAVSAQAEDSKWFDMENCSMCKLMTAKPGLMESIKWETVKLSTGVATVETVTPEKMADYRVVVDQMLKMGKRLEKGEKIPVCGFCTDMGALMKKGAHHEFVLTSTGGLGLLTSPDAAIQKEIWAFNDKAQEAMKQMMPPPGEKSAQKAEGQK